MTDTVVTTEVDGPVLLITITRPEVKNAINREVAEAIAAALTQLDVTPGLVVGIITGAGGSFSAGMDLKAFAKGGNAHVPGRGFGGFAERPPDKPLIAAVEGFAYAGGLELALGCDLIFAADNAKFGIPEAKRGLVAGAGALLRLPHRIPFGLAMELALTGDPIDAARAYAVGLVDHLTPAGGALDAARGLAAAIGANAPLAVKRSKQILRGGLGLTETEFWEFQKPFTREIFVSNDAREGAIAFGEKRPPKWTGT